MKRYLLCTDLDRTLIPNGIQVESASARECFRQLVNRVDVSLAYVTGRHRALVEQAIIDFALPQPDFAIADVGSSIYRISPSGWGKCEDWDTLIAPDWQGLRYQELSAVLAGLPGLQLQAMERQGRYKLSFFVPSAADRQQVTGELERRLHQTGVKANIIWSIDPEAGRWLLDILPAAANKLQAIRFLMQHFGFLPVATVFAGDSGNDLDVLLSDIPSVLVANAENQIKEQVVNGAPGMLYIAVGGYLGMNGNYSAGILEGVAHYWPEIDQWLRQLSATGGY